MKSQSNNILIIGMTACPLGLMERQHGNMAIIIPLIDTLKNEITNAEIKTSLQFSEKFCKDHKITSLKYNSLFKPTPLSGIIALIDFVRTYIWKILYNQFKLNFKFLIKGKKIKEFIKADIIIDWSGDLFGNNGHPLHLLKHSFDLLTALNLNKPIFMMAASPGPFSTFTRKLLSKYVLNKITIISTRESWGYEILKQSQINKVPILKSACPAFLLKPSTDIEINTIIKKEKLNLCNNSTIGLTICGWNFIHNRYSEKRTTEELLPFVTIVKYIIDNLKADVLLIPHVFRTDNQNQLIHGPDTKISEQLNNLILKLGQPYKNKIKILKGIYTPAITKGIIGRCNLYISGRIHAGVAALSQNIPTILLAYAYKHYGFARLVKQENKVSNNFGGEIDVDDIINKINEAWFNREKISYEIKENMIEVERLVKLNAKISYEIIKLNKQGYKKIPLKIIELWINQGDKRGSGLLLKTTLNQLNKIPEIY